MDIRNYIVSKAKCKISRSQNLEKPNHQALIIAHTIHWILCGTAWSTKLVTNLSS